MIYCQLKDILDSLPDGEKDSYRGHAVSTGVGWQQFWQLMHNKTQRVSLGNLQAIRDYLAPRTDQVKPGKTRFYLGEIMKERGLIQMKVSEEAEVSYVTVNRTVNNMMRYVDYSVTDRLFKYLEIGQLEDLLDTGGLLVWRPDDDATKPQ